MDPVRFPRMACTPFIGCCIFLQGFGACTKAIGAVADPS